MGVIHIFSSFPKLPLISLLTSQYTKPGDFSSCFQWGSSSIPGNRDTCVKQKVIEQLSAYPDSWTALDDLDQLVPS